MQTAGVLSNHNPSSHIDQKLYCLFLLLLLQQQLPVGKSHKKYRRHLFGTDSSGILYRNGCETHQDRNSITIKYLRSSQFLLLSYNVYLRVTLPERIGTSFGEIRFKKKFFQQPCLAGVVDLLVIVCTVFQSVPLICLSKKTKWRPSNNEGIK